MIFAAAIIDDTVLDRDLLRWASCGEQSGPEDHTTRQFDDRSIGLISGTSGC